MKVLTLDQPFASIVSLGLAQWITDADPIKHKGEIAIHANATKPNPGRIPKKHYGPWADRLGEVLELGRVAEPEVYGALPLSMIVAVITLGRSIPTGRYDPPAYDNDLKAFDFSKGRYMAPIVSVVPIAFELKQKGVIPFELWDLGRTREKAVRDLVDLFELASENGGSDDDDDE
jgi:hypothetical protein